MKKLIALFALFALVAGCSFDQIVQDQFGILAVKNAARGLGYAVANSKTTADDEAVVAAYELLPIENESRVLPKTGYYKGTPFYGSWDQRNAVRLIFKDEMKKLCAQGSVNFIEWVDPLLNDKGELDFECMEKPKSVHLSRASYPHWQGRRWSGLSENKPAPLEDFFA